MSNYRTQDMHTCKKRCSSHTPRQKIIVTPQQLTLSPPKIQFKTLKQEREKRKSLATTSISNYFSASIVIPTSPSNQQIESLEKQWEQLKKNITPLSQNKNPLVLRQASSFKIRRNDNLQFNLSDFEDMKDRSEPHTQQVKQFTIQANYSQMQRKMVPITTINLGIGSPKEKSYNSEVKSTENSTQEKKLDSSIKTLNFSLGVVDRNKLLNPHSGKKCLKGVKIIRFKDINAKSNTRTKENSKNKIVRASVSRIDTGNKAYSSERKRKSTLIK